MEKLAVSMVLDKETGECYHLKHLIKAHLNKVKADKNTTEETRSEFKGIETKLDGMTENEMDAVLRRFEMKAPISGNDLSEPFEDNFMISGFFEATEFSEKTGFVSGYLRPELAREIFINFKRLLEFNQGDFFNSSSSRCLPLSLH
jgi:glycyl-tRNA synthetase